MNGRTAIVPAHAIVPLPPEVRSAASVRAAVRLDELQALHPQHELFAVWYRQDPKAPFAVVMRISKARIAADGWPLLVDAERRVVRIDPPDPEAFAPPAPEPRRQTFAQRERDREAAEQGREFAASPEGVDGV
jgi:hypothetical protein